MRIAVSGTHYSGKSSLVRMLSRSLREYTAVEEPYFLLEEEGYEFFYPPTLEDYKAQFSRSLSAIEKSGANTLFDRCPLDCLAYALVLSPNLDAEEWLEKAEKALQKLDLILFLPIEYRDRILVPSSQDKRLRKKMDENLGDLFDGMEKVHELAGSLDERLERALQLIPRSS